MQQTPWHGTAQHSTAQHSTAQHSTAQHSTAQHSTAQHSTAQHVPTGKAGAKQVYSRAAWMLATALSVCPDCISKRQPSMKNPIIASSVSAMMLAGAPSRSRRTLSCFSACTTKCQSLPLQNSEPSNFWELCCLDILESELSLDQTWDTQLPCSCIALALLLDRSWIANN